MHTNGLTSPNHQNGSNGSTNGKSNGAALAFCPDCGTLVASGAKFCSSCGHTLTLVAPTPPQVIANTLQQEQPTAVLAPVMEAPAPSTTAERRFPVKKIAIAGVAAVALLGAAAGTLTVLKGSDTSPQTARTSLIASRTEVRQVVSPLADAEKLSDLRAIGAAAAQHASALQAQSVHLQDISGKPAGREASAVVSSERQLLDAMADLKGLTPEHIDQYPTLRSNIDSALRQVQASGSGLKSVGQTAALMPSMAAFEDGLQNSDDVVQHADQKLRAWKRSYRRAKRAQRAKLASLQSYAGFVGGQLAVYSGLRHGLDQWLEEFGDDTMAYGQASEFLNDAANKRKDVRDAIASRTPPASLSAQHASLIAVLSDAIVAMTDAGDAAATCTADMSCFGDDFRDTAQWQSFHDASERITIQYGAAYSRWEQGIAQKRNAIRHQRMPRPPAV